MKTPFVTVEKRVAYIPSLFCFYRHIVLSTLNTSSSHGVESVTFLNITVKDELVQSRIRILLEVGTRLQ